MTTLKLATNGCEVRAQTTTGQSHWSRPSNSRWDAFCRACAVAAICIAPAIDILMSDDASSQANDTVASSSSSTDTDPATQALGKDWMIGGYGGMPYTYNSDVTAKQNGAHNFTVKDVAWDGEPFEDPIYYGVRIVRWAGEGRFGSMLDFTHSKAIANLKQTVKATGTIADQPVPADGPLNALFERLEFSHGHNMLSINGLARLGRIAPKVWPYIGLGVGVNLPHSEVQLQTDAKRSYEYQYTGPMAQGLVGLEFRTSKVSYFIEYKFTLAKYLVPLVQQDGTEIGLFADLYRQFQRWIAGEEPPSGWVGTQLNSHQAIAGAGVRIQK